MLKYFPLLRGKRAELIAIRNLAEAIAESKCVLPIIEPVNPGDSTLKSLKHFVEASMPFLFICNPIHGTYQDDRESLRRDLIYTCLNGNHNWTPTFYLNGGTDPQWFRSFLRTYGEHGDLALLYYGLPTNPRVIDLIRKNEFKWHIFIGSGTPLSYMRSIPPALRVIIEDRFVRRYRNADYPRQEFFSDRNTRDGNPRQRHFGDFSIVGDHYVGRGGPAHAVALHHLHYAENSRHLYVTHFLSDRTETTLDRPGKTLEALQKLTESLENLQPSNTLACDRYRQLFSNSNPSTLETMKRLAIQHHLEIMLGDGLNDFL